MSNNNITDEIVQNPTYMENIRLFFEPEDIACMRGNGIDLGTYEGVKFNALRIYFRTEEDTMPPPLLNRPWSEARKRTFYNWMKNDYPRGVVTSEPTDVELVAARIRKNIASLENSDIELLKHAFSEVMKRNVDDPKSYFAIAGIHWLPGPNFYCRHHENAYNPWHRLYLMEFEDALRSVEGCESVTVPYWDITSGEISDVVYEEPFATYTIPKELCPLSGSCYPTGSITSRYTREEILKNIQQYDIAETISIAGKHSHWERFNGWDAGRQQDGIILAHDSGHMACGLTLRNQDIAAFDPLFWFFHANWDRLWWKWQQDFDATTLTAFKTHLAGSANWLDDPVLNNLPPFNETTAETINLNEMGVDYEHPVTETSPVETPAETPLPVARVFAAQRFSVNDESRVSVRVKDVHRLEIPGSFDVNLMVGDRTLAKRAFFQATEPKHCETCRNNELVSFDFIVNQADLRGENVHINIRLLLPGGGARQFPLSSCGNPTVNARLLLKENLS